MNMCKIINVLMLVWESENLVAGAGDEDGVLAVATDGAVFHFDGPVIVFVNVVGGFTETRHGLYTDSVTFDKLVTVAFFAVVGDFGRFMHGFADTVTDVVFDYAKMAFS